MAAKKIKIGSKISFILNDSTHTGEIEWIASSGRFVLVKDHDLNLRKIFSDSDTSINVEVHQILEVLK